MRIANYEAVDLERVDAFLQKRPTLDTVTVEELLKTCNVSFVLEEINRWQSTMICELKDSYVQQSQRYVTLTADGYTLPPQLNEEDRARAEELIAEAFALYEEMSRLKADFTGRPKPENYLYGIPVEDARYILPLAVKTNITVATTGDKLLDWFRMMNRPLDRDMFADIHDALLAHLPKTLGTWLDSQAYSYEDTGMMNQYYKEELEAITPQQPVVLLHTFEKPELKAGLGALTSTKAEAPSAVLNGWGAEADDKAKGVISRVMGYGHTSIAEQCRTTFGMMFSLVTYHQQERHRLPSTYREPWLNILLEPERPPVIPQTVIDGGFESRYRRLVQDMQRFQQRIAGHYKGGLWRYFLLNCQQVKIITSTNARMDCGMLAERICNNAQWEINRIAVAKLEELRKLSDILYKTAVPSCVYGTCKEGKMTCGRAAEMREKYRIEL